METRPKLKPRITFTDKIVELLGYLSLIFLCILVLYNYSRLPDTIPIHFDFSGKVDNYGAKTNLYFLAGLATILFTGMTILNKFPHIFNYPVKITKENALKQYILTTRMIRFLKLMIVLVFFIVTYEIILISDQTNKISILVLHLLLGLIFIPVIYFIVKSLRNK